ncbi:YolD-like family protein [Sporosarcina sp. FSL W7-1283]|uniref:YolD-like family protein n=1 Tax=Sporosarcina sp. FSL W7-1283 TaxID=2921560 RepID=UPI0030FC4B25
MEGNRDRGAIKWTSLFIPEHLELIREWYAEDDYVEKPELDQFDWDNIQQTLEAANKRQCITQIQTWKDGKINPYRGKILEINAQSKSVMLEDPFCIERIVFSDITNVQCVN